MPDYLSDKTEAITQYQESKIRARKRQEEKAKKEAEEEKLKSEDKSPEKEEAAEQAPADQASQNSEAVSPKDESVEECVVDETMEKHIKDINSLNDQLVKKLQAQDGAFSIGEASDEMLAIKFGMINESDALKSLALQVQDAGRDVEEASRVRDQWSFTKLW